VAAPGIVRLLFFITITKILPIRVIKTMIKDLEKRKDKAMIRSDTDDL
jgi:hypothetical protein